MVYGFGPFRFDAAQDLRDLAAVQGNRLEKPSGKRAGQHKHRHPNHTASQAQ
jgi:hypothetical protein